MLVRELQAVEIRKVYPGTTALDGVTLAFQRGKIHALIGKNGAGKSTLVKILSGAVQPTSGHILLDGRQLRLRSPRDAFHRGIATVYQELSLVPELSVGENVLFGRLPKKPFLGGRWIIHWPEVWRTSRAVLAEIGVELDVRAKVGRLGMAQQQLVELCKAMSFRPGALILDEPTSALAHHEVRRLFELLRGLARQGVAIVYVSHRLHELPQVAHMVSVLRDGRYVGTVGIGDATPERIVEMMFGSAGVTCSHDTERRVSAPTPAAPATSCHPTPVLEVRRLSRRGKLLDVSFSLDAGEVVGLAGMLGSGRTELLMSIFGAPPPDSGEVHVAGRRVPRPSPGRMKRLGVGLTPEDRKRQALVPLLSTRDNLCLAALGRIALKGLIWKGRQRPLVEQLIRRLHIAMASAEAPVRWLSGGNQQKVVVGNWLATQPRVMLLDEPTRGIDIQAKQQIFQLIRQLSRQGVACLMVSSELEELLEVCQRILVMRKGRVVEQFAAEGLALDRLFRACMEP